MEAVHVLLLPIEDMHMQHQNITQNYSVSETFCNVYNILNAGKNKPFTEENNLVKRVPFSSQLVLPHHNLIIFVGD